MTRETVDMLVAAALEARRSSYCPYSHFAVGAALLCRDGTLYTGANIECASHTPTVCAERVAFFRAVHEGKRSFEAIAVVGGGEGESIDFACPPCGVCRQVMAEFCGGDFEIILDGEGGCRVLTLAELLPHGFDKNYL